MLHLSENRPKRSVVDQRKKADNHSLVFTAKYPQSQALICPSCRSLNEFNPDLFLNSPHIEKEKELLAPDKNNPILINAWWVD